MIKYLIYVMREMVRKFARNRIVDEADQIRDKEKEEKEEKEMRRNNLNEIEITQ